jgi:mono/diheme cytochrome c family protein
MRAFVIAEPKQEYESWISGTAPQTLGRGEWEGSCAKCHGLQGQGGYGPAIANSSLLTQPQSLRQLLLNGQNRIKPISNYMPPVGRGWTNKQFDALFAYVKQNVYKAAPNGG